MKNNNKNIEFLSVKKPLSKHNDNDKILIKKAEVVLFDIGIKDGSKINLIINSILKFSVISPDMTDGIYPDFFSPILQFDDFFISILINNFVPFKFIQSGEYSFSMEFDPADSLNIEFSIFKNLESLIKSRCKNMPEKLTVNKFREIGIIIDLEYFSTKDINFSRMKNFFYNMPLFILIKSINKSIDRYLMHDLDGFFGKLKLNDIPFIIDIQYFQPDNENETDNSERKINCSGYYIEHDSAAIEERIFANKQISDQDIVIFSDKKIPDMKTKLLVTVSGNGNTFHLIEQHYLNAASDIFLIFKDVELNGHIKSYHALFLPLLFVTGFFIVYDLLYSFIRNDKLKKAFLDIIKMKYMLRIIFDNALTGYVSNGIMPLKKIKSENEPSGFFLGNDLYISLITEKVFNKVFYIPDETLSFYCLTTNSNMNRTGFFSYKGKERHLLFQRNESVVILNSGNEYGKLISSEIKVCIHTRKNISRAITEKAGVDIIIHKINLKLLKNKTVISYSSDSNLNLNRKVAFHITGAHLSPDIEFEDKKIHPYKTGNEFIEFSIVNSTNDCTITVFDNKND